MAIPYFPMYAQDWLSDPGVSALSFEEQGVFFHLMCRMWQTSTCSLPDDDAKISRLLKMSHLRWKRIKDNLQDVLTFEGGVFFSNRLHIEFELCEKTSGVNSKSAKKRWEVKQAKLLRNKDLQDANALRTECHKDKDKDKDYKEEYIGDKSPPPSVLMMLWNQIVKTPQVTSLNKTREAKCRLRLKEHDKSEWAEIFTKISTTPFLQGENDKGWRADFDWIISNDTNPMKVLEGKYDNKKRGGISSDFKTRFFRGDGEVAEVTPGTATNR